MSKQIFALVVLLTLNINTCLGSDATPVLRRTPSGHFFGPSGAIDTFDYYIGLCNRGTHLFTRQVGDTFTVNGVAVSEREHFYAQQVKLLNDAKVAHKEFLANPSTAGHILRASTEHLKTIATTIAYTREEDRKRATRAKTIKQIKSAVGCAQQ